ncbi:MAG TPA: Flp pilus assembly protein CpaB [Bryobacteraceae bacterium]|nr:Flp pilus assembly protein CpaB [Bryobacteraceae bacterium]
MNKRFLGVLIFAFVVASGASLLLYRLLANRPQEPAKAAAATSRIVLATRDLEPGTVLKEEDVKLTDWSGPIPAGASTRSQDLVGRGVVTGIIAKEPVLESRLAAKGAGGGLASMIPPGMRAVAIHVSDVSSVAGFVVPGMRVDVLISGTAPGVDNRMGTVTKTLLQNMEVLSAGQDFKKDNEGKPVTVPVINLLATPEQAEQLSLAASSTNIQLVLRNPLDHNTTKTPGTALGRLFTGGRNPIIDADAPLRPVRRAAAAPAQFVPVMHAGPAPPKTPFVMEIISGTKKVETKFENAGEAK